MGWETWVELTQVPMAHGISGWGGVIASDDTTRRLRGRVKWFDPVKGFGFVVADEGGSDILLHANVLRNFGQSSVADSATVEIDVQETERGRQAVEVHAIEPPDDVEISGLSDLQDIDPEVMRNAPLQPARVKWFDKAKGFGFANTFGNDEDVFVQYRRAAPVWARGCAGRRGRGDPGDRRQARTHGNGGVRMGNGGQVVRLTLATAFVALAGMAGAAPCREDAVTLRGDGDQARFRVELADEEAERAQGLMNRDTLARGAGDAVRLSRAAAGGLLDEEHAHPAGHDLSRCGRYGAKGASRGRAA